MELQVSTQHYVTTIKGMYFHIHKVDGKTKEIKVEHPSGDIIVTLYAKQDLKYLSKTLQIFIEKYYRHL